MKYLRWLLVNGGMMALMILGWIYDIGGARNIVYFMVWFFTLVSLTFAIPAVRDSLGSKPDFPAISPKVDLLYDVTVILFFAWFGCFVSAGAYTLQTLMTQYLFEEVAKAREVRSHTEVVPPTTPETGQEYA